MAGRSADERALVEAALEDGAGYFDLVHKVRAEFGDSLRWAASDVDRVLSALAFEGNARAAAVASARAATVAQINAERAKLEARLWRSVR